MVTAHYPPPTARCVFPQRPRIEVTDTARRRIWTSRCGRFRVVHSTILYGLGALPPVYRAEAHDEHGWTILSRHRKFETAAEACEKRSSQLAVGSCQ